ncbi:adaptin N terminal region-domain-containing protein [Ochromonadaceae sp. CCMP2298]|nr:adaptin N terminal region-domain-containing protein [Ochromonadaceae sp. CCMP2298]
MPKPLAATLLQEFQNLKDKFKNEDDGAEKESPYQYLEKATVLQECRIFHDATVVTQNPRRCCQMITKLLFLIVRGESFSSTEVTEVFFGVTKLFQSSDVNLRRMMYLFIKEVAETCNPDDVIIVTSSLTKDMNTGEDLYRANSMRVLAKIIDATMLGAIERYLKQAIVDRNAFVASSALMAGLRLFATCPEVVRRWINEVQEAVNSSSDMVQYHALSLLYKIKQHDRLAVSKIVQQLSKGSLRSPLATCLLIRYTSSLLHEDMGSTNAKASYQFLENCLRHKNEMVIYEAAKAMCNLPGVERSDLNPAITVLQLFLSSPKPSLRFAAMRTLSEVAVMHPISVAKCNDDMELLVSDANRSIATLAITTLLKTGTEGSIERLMKQISSFMSEIGDEFKIVVVKAIRELCLKYPKKHRVMVGFLATFLREEGGYEFKKSIVDSIVELMGAISETKESSLLHLCEFIEDCEFSELIVQIMHIIGSTGPHTPSPSRYIRFIFNRVILENAAVRAAAVSTLGSFATRVPELRPSVVTLLKRSLADEDDEVRDRAVVLLQTLGSSTDEAELKFVIDEPLPMTFAALERSVRAYISHPLYASGAASTGPITFASLPIVEEAYVPPANISKGGAKKKITASSAADVAEGDAAPAAADPAAAVYAVPQFAALGRAFRSTGETSLTETEMEYVVSCVKHIFADHVVLQFNILNTIDDQQLQDVTVNVEVGDPDVYTVESVVPAPVARYGEQACCFVSLKRTAQDFSPVTMSCELTFRMVQVDPVTGEVEGDEKGFDEEFPLEDLEVATNDFMAKVSLGDFRRSWDQMGSDGEVLEKFALQFKKLEEAVAAIVDFLGMQPVDGTGTVAADTAATRKPHTLHLSGVFVGNVPVMVRAQLQMDDASGVVLKMAVRSQSQEVSQIVAECIR